MREAQEWTAVRRALWLAAVVLASFFRACGPAAALSPGDTITSDTVLTADIVDPTFAGLVITIGADNVTLDGAGYRIDTPNAAAVIFTGNHTGITIKNVDVSGTGSGYGVGVWYSSNVRVEQVHALQCAVGIYFYGEEQGNSAVGCDCSGSQYGIYFSGPQQGNSVSGCTCSGCKVGIRTMGGTQRGLRVRDNEVRNCTRWGMEFGDCYDVDVAGANVGTGSANGISLEAGSGHIQDVDVSGTGTATGTGVQVAYSPSVTIERVQARRRAIGINLAHGNQQQGTVVSGCDCSGSQTGIATNGVYGSVYHGLTLTNNDVRDCTDWGMYLSTIYDSEIGGDNLATGCANGILVSGSDLRINGVDVSGSGSGTGVAVYASNTTVEGVRARQRQVGIHFFGTLHGNTARGCDCSGSRIGILSDYGESDEFVLSGNTLRDCTEWGMALQGPRDAVVDGGNLFQGCANGMVIGGGQNVRVAAVDVSGTEDSGIGIYASNGSAVTLDGVIARHRAIGLSFWDVSGELVNAHVEANAVGVNVNTCPALALTRCTIATNDVGVHTNDSPDLTIHECTITGNTSYGVANSSAQAVDARHNWWGDANGPTDTNPPNTLADGIGPNPAGRGDWVTDYVLYDPVTVPNLPPVANAGPDRTVEANTTGGANVALDGSASSDPEGGALTYAWDTDGDGQFDDATGATPIVYLALGTRKVTLQVTDSGGLTGTADVTIKVVDTTPPSMTLTVLQSSPWPPNHKLVLVATVTDVKDICDPDPIVMINVSCNETNDPSNWKVVKNGALWEIWVAAERLGSGSGREYYLDATATDASHNQVEKQATITVAHDQGKK